MAQALIVLVWLFLGYSFTYWFVNYFLDDRRFADTGDEPTPLMLIFMTVAGPIMALIMFIFVSIDFVVANFGEGIKRFYGMRG